jgi:DNA repair protein RadC
VLVHNHPSGNPSPSQDDLTITKKLKDAVKTIDIYIHDHLIIAGNDIYSFADHGLI